MRKKSEIQTEERPCLCVCVCVCGGGGGGGVNERMEETIFVPSNKSVVDKNTHLPPIHSDTCVH